MKPIVAIAAAALALMALPAAAQNATQISHARRRRQLPGSATSSRPISAGRR